MRNRITSYNVCYTKLLRIVFIAALAGMGFGAINEIVEFMAVLAVPDNGVGGYYNTAIDLVSNAIGATLAAVFILTTKLGLSKDTQEV